MNPQRSRLPGPAVALLVVCALAAGAHAQQVADTAFAPQIERPAYRPGRGPVVLVDEGHNNFHTTEGRYLPFAQLLRRDGYVVRGVAGPLTAKSLAGARVLVVSNAIAARNVDDWSLPNPSAFADEEIAAVREWVRRGGSLLLIADHMPAAGAAEKLAAAFGVIYSNGFAFDERQKPRRGIAVFRAADGTLRDHPVTRGRAPGERIDAVATFTGSAFRVEGKAAPLLVFGEGFYSLTPQVAWQFDDRTPRVPVAGWYQGATLRAGKGRAAFFGEAAMFTAQLAGPDRRPIGMNAPEAGRNAQFLLNLMHWLTGLLG